MSKTIQSIRGMHDILPTESYRWQFVERVMLNVMRSYGYREIRTPAVESTDLFCRSIGEVTDIVEKEMYTFKDRNEDLLTLRPENTASTVRAGIEHGLLYNQIQRLWYMGPMFRHERPQKGRYRQFHQFGVETFGVATPDIEAEHILMAKRLWDEFSLSQYIKLELNTLGSAESRQKYKDVLVEYFQSHKDQLDEDSLRRLESNPLRILDSKNSALSDVIANAPILQDHLDQESSEHFECLKSYLDAAGIQYTVNPRLVRGLDYYCKTVFEWVTDKLGAQGTVCAGGRYDGLVEQLGGRAAPAAGFALGIERLLELMADVAEISDSTVPDIYLVLQGEKAVSTGLILAEEVRNKLSKIKLMTHCGGGSFKSQMKKADKSGALIALIIGDDEVEKGNIVVKSLRETKEQETLAQTEIINYLKDLNFNE